MNGFDNQKLHFVLIPLMAQGHMIPMVDFARLLAERGGVLVTLITTPFNLSRIKTIADRVQESGLPIRFVPLRFPCREAGLPDGCENIDVVPETELLVNFFTAAEMLREPVELHLRRHPPLPSCIIADMCLPWSRHVSREFQVPRYIFQPMCCFTVLCEHNLLHHKIYESTTDENAVVVVPDLPHRIEVTTAQAPGLLAGHGWEGIREEIRESDSTADGVVTNTFADLERIYIDRYKKAKGKKTWAIGPVSLCNRDAPDRVARGDKASIDENGCLGWLDSMKPRSVLYASLGSLARTPRSQLVEIGMGLETSNHPFIWVIKAGDKCAEVEEWLGEGFEERNKTRSLIIRGWAPQMTILSHPSIGGFLTHCGWNSSLEAISAGIPMITWPCFADQFLNERLIVEVLRIGVAVGVKSPVWWDDGNVQVKREEVEKAVERLMGDGEEAEERRKRAGELREMAREAMEVGGSSHTDMTLLIQDVMLHAADENFMGLMEV